MADSIRDQVVVVVGASSGIGKSTVKMAAQRGARVVAVARREDRLRLTQTELENSGIESWFRVADVTDAGAVEAAIQSIMTEFGRIDIAVYAAGTNAPDRAMTVLGKATWHSILDTNLNGAFYFAHAVLPPMREARTGHIIFVSSTAGVIADLSGAAYQASKRGVLGLSHAIRLEEKNNGIRTCCIMPGLTNTELVEKRPEKLPEETLRKALQAEDVAETIVHVMGLPPRASIPEVLMVPTLA